MMASNIRISWWIKMVQKSEDFYEGLLLIRVMIFVHFSVREYCYTRLYSSSGLLYLSFAFFAFVFLWADGKVCKRHLFSWSARLSAFLISTGRVSMRYRFSRGQCFYPRRYDRARLRLEVMRWAVFIGVFRISGVYWYVEWFCLSIHHDFAGFWELKCQLVSFCWDSSFLSLFIGMF